MDTRRALHEMLALVDELELYETQYLRLKRRLETIDRAYKEGRYNHATYQRRLKGALGSLPREDVLASYAEYLDALRAGLRAMNQQIAAHYYGMVFERRPVVMRAATAMPQADARPAMQNVQVIRPGIQSERVAVTGTSHKTKSVRALAGAAQASTAAMPQASTLPAHAGPEGEVTSRQGFFARLFAWMSAHRPHLLHLRHRDSAAAAPVPLAKPSEPAAVRQTASSASPVAQKQHARAKGMSPAQDIASELLPEAAKDAKHARAPPAQAPLELRAEALPETGALHSSTSSHVPVKAAQPKGLFARLYARIVHHDREIQLQGSLSADGPGSAGISPLPKPPAPSTAFTGPLARLTRTLHGVKSAVEDLQDTGIRFKSSTEQPRNIMTETEPEGLPKMNKVPRYLLAEEARNIRKILKRDTRPSIRKPSQIGAMANSVARKLSLWLLDTFPGFFRGLYGALRIANMPVLSNTYISLMILGTLMAFLTGTVVFFAHFWLLGSTLGQVIGKGLFMGVAFGILTFALFYGYPYTRLKYRRRSINTNLPFAINHMAAISSSGVPPVGIFKMIMDSNEYGEVTKEAHKVVDLIELFGYDLLTSIRTVASTTPSESMREFLEGILSTVEAGADLPEYLHQKSQEIMLSYRLERQRYVEVISTYSDIYTGILIAAPLFFIITMSLVNMLGGKLGGMDVSTLMVVVTYIGIPALNVLFLVFVEATQPDM
ncbi:hypothetical protein AUJ68_05855 [Candidatus Woesearchaeota archaeon CG1_02_57_44]|nr:MAG: hypothetical protein AUJ68_05855 [Candidatus Woesearchaeota archaeon CG1_02_57_44]